MDDYLHTSLNSQEQQKEESYYSTPSLAAAIKQYGAEHMLLSEMSAWDNTDYTPPSLLSSQTVSHSDVPLLIDDTCCLVNGDVLDINSMPTFRESTYSNGMKACIAPDDLLSDVQKNLDSLMPKLVQKNGQGSAAKWCHSNTLVSSSQPATPRPMPIYPGSSMEIFTPLLSLDTNHEYLDPLQNPTSTTRSGNSPVWSLTTLDSQWMQQQPITNQPSAEDTKPSEEHPTKRKAAPHSFIERRYRHNINDCITKLKNTIPALSQLAHNGSPSTYPDNSYRREDISNDQDDEVIDGVQVASKLNKATILQKAVEYIQYLKQQCDFGRNENAILQQLIHQLPGGDRALVGFMTERLQREQQALQEHLLSSDMKQYQVNKNKSRKQKQDSTTHHDHIKTKSSRMFMVAFLATTTYVSTASPPLGDYARQFDHRHSRTAASLTGTSRSRWSLQDGWLILQTVTLCCCLAYLLTACVQSYLIWVSKQPHRRSQRPHHPHPISPDHSDKTSQYTNDTQQEVRHLVIDSLSNLGDAPPRGRIHLLLVIVKETLRFLLWYGLGYHVHSPVQPSSVALKRARLWANLNEIECLGGDPGATRWSMLHTCLKTLNIFALHDRVQENGLVDQMRPRVFITTALKISALFPNLISLFLANGFWQCAIYESYVEDDRLMQSLVFDCHQDSGDDLLKEMVYSRAWKQTLDVIRYHIHPNQATLSYPAVIQRTARCLTPVTLLARYHLLDNLHTQFGRLLITITAPPPSPVEQPVHDTCFDPILDMVRPTGSSSEHPEAHQHGVYWFAVVGAIVEATWKNDLDIAEHWIAQLRRAPVSFHEPLHDLSQTSFLFIMSSVVHIRRAGTFESQATQKLERAECLCESIRHYPSKRELSEETLQYRDMELAVYCLAEFAVSWMLLEAWVHVWQLVRNDTRVDNTIRLKRQRDIHSHLRTCARTLRRMARHHALDGLLATSVFVDRLCRLDTFVSSSMDAEHDEIDHDNITDNNDEPSRAQHALAILKGLA